MIAKITVGTSLYGALAYNGQKVNEGEGRLLAVNRIFDDGSGHVDIARAEQDFKRFMPEQVRTRNKVIHISLNPHPDDRLTDAQAGFDSLAATLAEIQPQGGVLSRQLGVAREACPSLPTTEPAAGNASPP